MATGRRTQELVERSSRHEQPPPNSDRREFTSPDGFIGERSADPKGFGGFLNRERLALRQRGLVHPGLPPLNEFQERPDPSRASLSRVPARMRQKLGGFCGSFFSGVVTTAGMPSGDQAQ